MNLTKKNIIKITLLSWLVTLFLLQLSQITTVAQTLNPGWTGKPPLPLSTFVNKNNWISNFQRNTGDTCYITTSDTCIYLHWKFGPSKRYKFAQCYQFVDLSLKNQDIIGIDVKGTQSAQGRNVQIKFEDGHSQALYRWDGLAGITRWCERIAALKKQFSYANDTINWGAITVVSFEVNAEPSENDVTPDSGTVAICKFRSDSITSWPRAHTFEILKDSSILPVVIKQTVRAILNRQDKNTGLF